MIYKHEHFFLDTDTQSVRDENGKALPIPSKAYRLLEVLCTQPSASVEDLRLALGEESEANLRQLGSKIRAAIGHDVLRSHNRIYSISGPVQRQVLAELASKGSAPIRVVKKTYLFGKTVLAAVVAIIGAILYLAPYWQAAMAWVHDRLSPPAPVVQSATLDQTASPNDQAVADPQPGNQSQDPQPGADTSTPADQPSLGSDQPVTP